MKTSLFTLKKELNSKKELLENARKVLKQEFIGIDKPIDAIIDNINSWFLLSEIQDRPFIINLWGLTGVGKTSLINRLVELIDYENFYYRFDLGHKKGKYSLTSGINELCENIINKPVIIALDEFQHARTLEGNGMIKSEKDDENRVLWDLIDGGKIQHSIYKYGIWGLREDVEIYKRLLSAGVKVENGKIVRGWEKCKEEYGRRANEEKLFIPNSLYRRIIDLSGDELNIKLTSELENVLLGLNGKESIQFLKKVISLASKPIERDFSESLIFVMGNLDEAYAMSNNYTIDISADDFYKASLKITISKIKNALKSRFRHEQIARLGNIHIIYPALSKNAYEKIIEKEIQTIQHKIYNLTAIKLNFQPSIIGLIYDEGVYPAQGVRPVLTTINHLVRNRIMSFLSTILNQNLKVNKIDILFEDKRFLRCSYLYEETTIFTEEIDISSELKKLNINKKDDMQSITAVHESGHAILSAVLLKTIPKYVYSSTVEDNVNGFVFSEFEWKYISQKEIVLRVALFLGGMAAEEIIFGKENVTNGCGGDLEQATNLVLQMLKKQGLGASKLSYEPKSPLTNFFFNTAKEIEKEAKEIIKQGFDLALQTLTEEKILLVELANYLSDHPFIKEKELESIINKYCSKNVDFITNGKHLFYREHLKQTHKQLIASLVISETSAVCLNKIN